MDISFFGAHGHLPLGVALLLAAVLGVLLVVIPGTGRIIQLRMVARRHRRAEAAPAEARVAANPGSAPAGAGDRLHNQRHHRPPEWLRRISGTRTRHSTATEISAAADWMGPARTNGRLTKPVRMTTGTSAASQVSRPARR